MFFSRHPLRQKNPKTTPSLPPRNLLLGHRVLPTHSMISGLQQFLFSTFAPWRVSVSSRLVGWALGGEEGAARTARRGTLECVLENTKISLHFALLTRRCQEPSRLRVTSGFTIVERVKGGPCTTKNKTKIFIKNISRN